MSGSLTQLRRELRGASIVLSTYGLRIASRWAAEQLTGLPPPHDEADEEAPAASNLDPEAEELLSRSVDSCSNRYLLAKSFFDLGEFQRAAAVLEAPDGQSIMQGLPSVELFLKAYSLYLVAILLFPVPPCTVESTVFNCSWTRRVAVCA